jgi:polysaccharide export outer membrane protein
MARPTAQPGVVDLSQPERVLPVERFVQPATAHIAPGDELDLRILGLPDLSGRYIVAPDGRINLSLVGSVQASGKSVEQLDGEVTSALAVYYRNIDVALNVSSRADRFVYVLGEVSRPGRYDFRPGDRVLHSLALAGGMIGTSRENGIVLLRSEPDGKDHAYRFDFGRIHQQLAPEDAYLQPGDIVFVPKSRLRTATDFAKEFLDVLGRAATTALVVDDLVNIRNRALSVR